MGVVYGLLAILFALVIALFILVLKYRCDVAFMKEMYRINNDYVKSCDKNWLRAIKLCEDVCNLNGKLLNQQDKEDIGKRVQ